MRRSSRCGIKRAAATAVVSHGRYASTASAPPPPSALTPEAIYCFLNTEALPQREYSAMLDRRSWLLDTYLVGYNLWDYISDHEKALVKEKLIEIRRKNGASGEIDYLTPLRPLIFLYGSCLAGTAFTNGDADFALTFPAPPEIGEAVASVSIELRLKEGETISADERAALVAPSADGHVDRLLSHGGYDKTMRIADDGQVIVDKTVCTLFSGATFANANSDSDVTKKQISVTDLRFSQHNRFFAISRIVQPQLLTTFYQFISKKAEESGVETDEDEVAKTLRMEEKAFAEKTRAQGSDTKARKKSAILTALEDDIIPARSAGATTTNSNEPAKPKLFLHRIFRARVPIMQFAPPSESAAIIAMNDVATQNFADGKTTATIKASAQVIEDPMNMSLDEDAFKDVDNKATTPTPTESLIDRLLREDAAREKSTPKKSGRFAKRSAPYATGSSLLDEALNNSNNVASSSANPGATETPPQAEKIELTTKTFSRFFKSREQSDAAAAENAKVAQVISDSLKAEQRSVDAEATTRSKAKLTGSSFPQLFETHATQSKDPYSLQKRDERHLASTPTHKQKKEHMDLSVALDGCRNSLLVRQYMIAYPVAVRGATFLLKHWGRRQGILNARRGWLSPYALSIMFIHCLHEHNIIENLVSTGLGVDRTLTNLAGRHVNGEQSPNTSDPSTNLDIILPPFPNPRSDLSLQQQYKIIPDLMRLFFCYYGGIPDPAAVVAASELYKRATVIAPAQKFDFDHGVVDIRPAPDRYLVREDWDKALEAALGVDTSRVAITSAVAKARFGDASTGVANISNIPKTSTFGGLTIAEGSDATMADAAVIAPHLAHHPKESIEALLKAARRERWHRLGHEAMLIRDPYEDHSLGRSVEFFHAEAIREEFRKSSGLKYGGLDNAKEFLRPC